MVSPVKRVEFSYPRSDLLTLDSGVANLRGDGVVWWYSGVRHNPIAKTVPMVDVLFKMLVGDTPNAFTSARVPLSNLPHYRIGTIWREGKCISDTELAQDDFKVNFSPGGWSITSRNELYDDDLEEIFPDDAYPLKYRRDKSYLLKFTDSLGRTLLVPCIEFFVRAYARNMDVCRAIATLSFSDVMSCFYVGRSRDAFRWVVRPTYKTRDYDDLFHAHLLYDDYTEGCVRRINSRFSSSRPGDIVLPKVEPWFQGPAELRCRGKWIKEEKIFLCLDLCGSSDPEGPDIEWIRDSYDSTDGSKDSGRVVMPVAVRTAEADEFMAEESLAEPDGRSEIIIMKAPPFTRLGKAKRKVNKVRNVISTDKGRLGPRPPSANSHSSGTGYGSGKGVGKSEHVADEPMDAQIHSLGFLNDIWNAFLSIKSANSDRVNEVSWYTPSTFRSSSPPRTILFNTDGAFFDRDVFTFVYLDSDMSQRRGMLILRVTVDNQDYLCFEIQRPSPTEAEPDPKGNCGVLMRCEIRDPKELEQFLSEVYSATRQTLGRFRNIRGIFPVATKIFDHRRGNEVVPHRGRLINAFKDLNVILD